MKINQPIAKSYKEVSAKISALTLLTNLGYKFVSLLDIEAMRISQLSVVLENVASSVES